LVSDIREQLASSAGQPADYLTGVLGEQAEIAGRDLEFVHVHLIESPPVELDDGLAGPARGQLEERLRPRERGEVDGSCIGGVGIDSVYVPVLVAVAILQVQQPPGIVCPLVDVHAAVVVGGDAPRFGVGVKPLHPDVEPVLPRGQICESGAVGGDRRARPDGRVEQVFHGDRSGSCHELPIGVDGTSSSPARAWSWA
jgi:hypothetical protein